MAGRRVLITGVASVIGTELARRLARDPAVEQVTGVDEHAPGARLDRVELIEADIRNPVLGRILPGTGADTVVHNKIIRQPGGGLSPQAAHDINVIGTLQLLAACERSPAVRTIVIRGSAGIYGAEPAAPQFFTEEMARLYPLRTRFQRDIGEIESLFETFSRRHPRVTCMMLRYQPAIGPSRDSQITRLLSLPAVPTYLGFDPRLQFVHADDAVAALVAAVHHPVRGPVNVAGPGTIGLTKLVRRAGKVTVPIPAPLFGTATAAGRRLGLPRLSPDFRRLLRHGRGVDLTRLTAEVGFRPRFSTPAAVDDWVRTHGGRRLVPSVRQLVPGG